MNQEPYRESLDRRGDLELPNGGGVLLFEPVTRTVSQPSQLRWPQFKELAAQTPER